MKIYIKWPDNEISELEKIIGPMKKINYEVVCVAAHGGTDDSEKVWVEIRAGRASVLWNAAFELGKRARKDIIFGLPET